MTGTDAKTIGQLNGRWALLFKAMLAANALLIVPVMSWATWTTLGIFELRQGHAVAAKEIASFMEAGPRYTTSDAARDQAVLRAEVATQFAEIKGELNSMSRQLDTIEKKMAGDDL